MPISKNIRNNNKGFTLVELILTVVILALVTAPFLSSFATASKTNTKAKKRQQANNIGEYLSERFKATDLSQIDASITTPNVDPSGILTYQIDNTKLPSQYGTNYTATVKLEPKAMPINDDITPVPVTVNASNSAVFMADFYKNDSLAIKKDSSTTHRNSTIRITYDPAAGAKPYKVSLDVDYCKGSDYVKTYQTEKIELFYNDVPEIYLFYTPFTSPTATNNDSIQITSNVTKEVKIHLTKQQVTANTLNPGRVYCSFPDDSGSLLTLASQLQGNYHKIFTDIVGTGNSVQTHKVISLYDMKVEVKYNGEKVLTYDSSKKSN